MALEKEKVIVHTAAPEKHDADEETYTPLTDIYEESDGTTVLVAEVPGAERDSMDIRVDKGVLTLSADGRRKRDLQGYSPTYTGFLGGRYFRAFALGDEVDREKIEANLSEGLLTIRLPRAEAALTRKIEIS